MRYPATEKLEIIRLVEQSHLPAKRTLDQIGIPRRTFYRWYDRYRDGGPEGLADRPSAPSRVWNRIPDDVRGEIVDLALEEPELSPRELAVRFTDTKGYFVSVGPRERHGIDRRRIERPVGPHQKQTGFVELRRLFDTGRRLAVAG